MTEGCAFLYVFKAALLHSALFSTDAFSVSSTGSLLCLCLCGFFACVDSGLV
jgi:hypothetical protein